MMMADLILPFRVSLMQDDEMAKIERELLGLKKKYTDQRSELLQCKSELKEVDSNRVAYEKGKHELKEARGQADRAISELEIVEVENDRCEKELVEAERECKALRVGVVKLKQHLEDALIDMEGKGERLKCTMEETDALCRRLFSSGMSVPQVQTFITEVGRLTEGKLRLDIRGDSKSYLNSLRRDLYGMNRLVAAIQVGFSYSIQQIDHDDSNFGHVTITTTFLGLKMEGVEGLVSVFLDCCGIPEGKDANAGADHILLQFTRMREELRMFREYLISEGREDLVEELPEPNEITITKAAKGGCCVCADNASSAQAKSRALMRKIYRLANPEMPEETFAAMTDNEIRLQIRLYILGCIIHERNLTLNEGSKRQDAWLKLKCKQEFHAQDRMDRN